MDTSVSSSSLSKDSLSLLERRLAHFKSAESVLCVSRRLFQKCPAAASQLEGELREAELRGAATNRCVYFLYWFGLNTCPFEKELLKVQYTANQTIPMTDSLTVGLTPP